MPLCLSLPCAATSQPLKVGCRFLWHFLRCVNREVIKGMNRVGGLSEGVFVTEWVCVCDLMLLKMFRRAYPTYTLGHESIFLHPHWRQTNMSSEANRSFLPPLWKTFALKVNIRFESEHSHRIQQQRSASNKNESRQQTHQRRVPSWFSHPSSPFPSPPPLFSHLLSVPSPRRGCDSNYVPRRPLARMTS